MTAADDVGGRVRGLVIEVAALLPERDVQNAWDLVEANEPGVALELLSTQLYEYEVVLDADLLAVVRELCERMGLDDRYWTLLGPDA